MKSKINLPGFTAELSFSFERSKYYKEIKTIKNASIIEPQLLKEIGDVFEGVWDTIGGLWEDFGCKGVCGLLSGDLLLECVANGIPARVCAFGATTANEACKKVIC